MGGYTRPNDMFLSLSQGKMTNAKAGVAYDGYVGTVVGIKRKTGEWEGNPVEKIEVHMIGSDGEGARIQFGAETFYALGFFARIRFADLQKPILLGVWKSKKNEKINLCYIKQNDETIKSPKDGEPEAFPQPEKVKLGSKTVYDWSKITPIFDELIRTINSDCPKESEVRGDTGPGEPSGVVTAEAPPQESEPGREPLPF